MKVGLIGGHVNIPKLKAMTRDEHRRAFCRKNDNSRTWKRTYMYTNIYLYKYTHTRPNLSEYVLLR